MLSGFLGKLTSQAIRGLARNLFPGFYDRGISANKALGELQQAGLGYRRTDFLADFRQGKSSWEQASLVRFVNLDKTPTDEILESSYHGVPDKYSFVFKATGTDVETGLKDNRYFFYHRDTVETRGSMQDEAEDWFTSEVGAYGLDVREISLVEGYINPIWGSNV